MRFESSLSFFNELKTKTMQEEIVIKITIEVVGSPNTKVTVDSVTIGNITIPNVVIDDTTN